jgi:hypothetical protein
MDMTWPKKRRKVPINVGGQFATLGANVVAMKYSCLMKSTLSQP